MTETSLDYWIALARSTISLPIETEAGWAEWVTVPVVQFPLAPREARAALEILGHLAEHGREVADILDDILKRYDCNSSGGAS